MLLCVVPSSHMPRRFTTAMWVGRGGVRASEREGVWRGEVSQRGSNACGPQWPRRVQRFRLTLGELLDAERGPVQVPRDLCSGTREGRGCVGDGRGGRTTGSGRALQLNRRGDGRERRHAGTGLAERTRAEATLRMGAHQRQEILRAVDGHLGMRKGGRMRRRLHDEEGDTIVRSRRRCRAKSTQQLGALRSLSKRGSKQYHKDPADECVAAMRGAF